MDMHEFQSKRLLERFGIPIPEFAVASSLQELRAILSEKRWSSAVLKAQIHAGGRGKAGGVKFAATPEELFKEAQQLLGRCLVTHQTGPLGLPVHQLLVSLPVKVVREYYVGLTLDRERARHVLIASQIGGVEIERTASERPECVLVLPLPLDGGFRSYHLIRLNKFMGWRGSIAHQGRAIVHSLVRAYLEMDASLLEVNPLAETQEGQLVALDAKLAIDDNALYRHPDLHELFDASQLPPQEALAYECGLAYVPLEGNIGCMVNGAGLAMATMDLLGQCGGEPANFLDVGGGASEERIAEGFKIILSDVKVKVILLNIFGGIMDCAKLAVGILSAVEGLSIQVPLVVRLEGTHAERGRELLKGSGLDVVSVDELGKAVRRAVDIAAREPA